VYIAARESEKAAYRGRTVCRAKQLAGVTSLVRLILLEVDLKKPDAISP
jgi:hypothetical protein